MKFFILFVIFALFLVLLRNIAIKINLYNTEEKEENE